MAHVNGQREGMEEHGSLEVPHKKWQYDVLCTKLVEQYCSSMQRQPTPFHRLGAEGKSTMAAPNTKNVVEEDCNCKWAL